MSRQRGAAMVVVLLIIAVITVVAVTVNEQVRYAVQRLENQRYNEQAYWYAIGGEKLARFLLGEEADAATIHPGQPWAARDAVFPIEGGALAGRIEDRQACFNLNNLYRTPPPPGEAEPGGTEKPAARQVFEKLLAAAGVPAETATLLVERLPDWVDADLMPQGLNGAEDLYYSALDLPYQPPNALMLSVSELKMIAPVEAEAWQRLRPLLCALPKTDTAINVNTLSPEQGLLLSAILAQQVTPDVAADALAKRPEEGWKSVEAFLASPQLAGVDLSDGVRKMLSVTSTYFRATIDVQYHSVDLRLYSRLERRGEDVRVYAREYGERF